MLNPAVPLALACALSAAAQTVRMATGSPMDTRDIYITGRLVLPDGLPPYEMIPVNLECPGGATAAMSDLRGEFRIRTASDFDRTLRTTTNCFVRVNVPGFEGASAGVGNIDPRNGIDVGPLVLKPLTKTEGTLISFNSFSAPEPARKEVLKSREDVQGGKLDSAARRLEKAIGLYPAYATAWYELGRVQERQGRRDQAAASYRKALEADGKYLSPQIQLAALAASRQEWEDAETRTAAVLKLAPDALPGVYFVHAVACYNRKKYAEAEESARRGLGLDRAAQFPKLASLLGTLLESRGDRQGAAEAFKTYLQRAPQAADAEKIRERLARLVTQ